ncbi:hypothetical protein [Streptomyces sp. NPDC004065]|uniref:hypothetical protein n=1 Tax=Streptomyces sp. NPDC004065 TaxID=3364689 RepID=UPI003850C47C
MRLEATRRPELHTELSRFLAAQLDADAGFHLGHGLSGDRTRVVLLHLAMLGLIGDELTVPELLAPHRPPTAAHGPVRAAPYAMAGEGAHGRPCAGACPVPASPGWPRGWSRKGWERPTDEPGAAW